MSREKQTEGGSPKPKLSRIEEHDTSEEEPDEDDIFLHELERENKMLEGVLKDLQGVIKKDQNTSIFKEKIEYSFEKQNRRDREHFSSIKQIKDDGSRERSRSNQRDMEGSNKRKHNFKRSTDRDSKERSVSSSKKYENPTKSSTNRNFVNSRRSRDNFDNKGNISLIILELIFNILPFKFKLNQMQLSNFNFKSNKT